MSEKKKSIGRAHFINLLSKGLSDFYNKDISFDAVANQLLLIELGRKPTDEVIGNWINSYATKSKSDNVLVD